MGQIPTLSCKSRNKGPQMSHATSMSARTAPPPAYYARAYPSELHHWLTDRLENPEATDAVMQEVRCRLLDVEGTMGRPSPLVHLFGVTSHVVFELDADEIPQRRSGCTRLRQRLMGALDELPTRYRNVLLLCCRDGMNCEDAAAASGLSASTVHRCLVHARVRLMTLTTSIR